MDLFQQMQPGDRAHSLRIYRDLQAEGHTHPDLLAAALLHDSGKSRCTLHLWERVLIVAAQSLLPAQVAVWGEAEPTGWRRPFAVARQHPLWGASMAEQAGAAPLTVALIRRHQEPPVYPANTLEDQLLSILQKHDNRQ